CAVLKPGDAASRAPVEAFRLRSVEPLRRGKILSKPAQQFSQGSPILFLHTRRIAKAIGGAEKALFNTRLVMSRCQNEPNEIRTHLGVPRTRLAATCLRSRGFADFLGTPSAPHTCANQYVPRRANHLRFRGFSNRANCFIGTRYR